MRHDTVYYTLYVRVRLFVRINVFDNMWTCATNAYEMLL